MPLCDPEGSFVRSSVGQQRPGGPRALGDLCPCQRDFLPGCERLDPLRLPAAGFPHPDVFRSKSVSGSETGVARGALLASVSLEWRLEDEREGLVTSKLGALAPTWRVGAWPAKGSWSWVKLVRRRRHSHSRAATSPSASASPGQKCLRPSPAGQGPAEHRPLHCPCLRAEQSLHVKVKKLKGLLLKHGSS